VPYLGHVVSGQGIRIAGSRVAELVALPRPTSGKQVQSFLGMINFLRAFIPALATLAAPLDALRTFKYIDLDDPSVWTHECESSFIEMKEAVAAAPILSKPQWDEPFSIATDASNVGIGAVLFQGTRDKPRYIVCVSRALSPSERNYSATKKELLGIIFALRKLKFYVAGRRFTVFTDHKALTHMFTQKKLNDMLERWLDELLDFTFDVEHLPGIANVLPDCLSRLYSVSEAPDSGMPAVLLAHADSAVVPPSVSDDSRVADSASRGLPVEIWRDSSLIPGSVVVSRQSCWLEPELVDALEGGKAGGDDEEFFSMGINCRFN
jgi:hypothetical protein